MSDVKTCPNCQRRLYFAADGRSLVCEKCGYNQLVVQSAPKRPTVAQLIHSVQWIAPDTRISAAHSAPIEELIARGAAAVKDGDDDRAFSYLERALFMESGYEERAQVWLWLSKIYHEPSEKRQCLEQVLELDPHNVVAKRSLAITDGRLDSNDVIDPNKLIDAIADSEPQTANVEQFTCPRCNGRLIYTPEHEALICEFCDYRLSIEGKIIKMRAKLGEFEQDFVLTMQTKRGHLHPTQMRIFQCPACVVEFLLAPEKISITCPYCNSVCVTETAETHDILPPQAIIPFTVSQEVAEKELRKWFKQHHIDHPRVSPIMGTYLPLWTFDIGGTIKWVASVVTQEERSVNLRAFKGERDIFYDDVLILATNKLPSTLSSKLSSSYDLSQLVQYDSRYLAAWPAERYQIALGDAAIKARKWALDDLRRYPQQLIHVSGFVTDLMIDSYDMIVISFKQVLLPVWVVRYKLEDKVYAVLVNGQTAEIFGERPQGIVGRVFGWLAGDQ